MKFEKEELIGVAVAIQKTGQSTIEEIQEFIQNTWNLTLTIAKIKRICDQFKKRDICSQNYIREENGEMKTAYSMSKPIYKNIPETAHLKDLINLPESNELLKQFENTEGSGSKIRLPNIRDYKKYKLTFEVMDHVLGTLPSRDEKFDLQLPRNNGEVVILPNQWYGFIRTNSRIYNKTNVAQYMAFSYGIVDLNGKNIEVVEIPIIAQKIGRGINKYESLPSGTLITTIIKCPTEPESNGFKPNEFKEFLNDLSETAIKGIGGYSRRFGRIKLIEFNIIQ